MEKMKEEIQNNSYVQYILKKCVTKESYENILISMLLTDGHVYEKGNSVEIVYKGLDKELHLVFATMIHEAQGVWPNTFFKGYDENGTVIYRTITRNKFLLQKLKKKSSHFRTSPKALKKEDFLSLYKPTLRSCFSEPLEIKKIILQLAMSAEGYVSPSFERNFRISVGFSCSHPALLKEWKTLFKELDINMNVKTDSNSWSGVSGLYVSDINDVKRFSTRIGFTPSTQVTNTKAPWKDYPKQTILERAIQYHELMSYTYRLEGIPIHKYRVNWKDKFSDYLTNGRDLDKMMKIKLDRLLVALKIIDHRIRPKKFLKVIDFLEECGSLSNVAFRRLTNLNGIYAWSRCRKALKAYYKNRISETRNWRSYVIKLNDID